MILNGTSNIKLMDCVVYSKYILQCTVKHVIFT